MYAVYDKVTKQDWILDLANDSGCVTKYSKMAGYYKTFDICFWLELVQMKSLFQNLLHSARQIICIVVFLLLLK